jgi:hypothetical protein
MVEPAPTANRQPTLFELQSTVQFGPQLTPHDDPELQSTLQLPRQEAVHA